MLVILQNTPKSYVWPINESRYMIWLFVAEIRTQYTPARLGIIFLPFSGRYGHFHGIILQPFNKRKRKHSLTRQNNVSRFVLR